MNRVKPRQPDPVNFLKAGNLLSNRMSFAIRGLIAASLVFGWLSMPARSQEIADTPRSHPEPARDTAKEPPKLPPEQTTHHVLELPGRTLKFTATAGAIRLSNDANEPQADVAFVAYQLEGTDRQVRPVSFAFNGGPGMASGWLQAGAIGPWRIPIGGSNGVPSGSPQPQPNAETWLDFTDLVFIDPPGTGYSRILGKGDAARRRLWSVDGDIDAVAETVRRWLDHAGRIVSPKYIVGESYGGFRGPRLVRSLQSDHGVGVTGLVLISPLLDVHVMSGYNDPFGWADILPSEVAASRALHGPVTRADLADVEQYAETGYLTDMMRGFHDAAAVARITDRVASLTGIDRAIVARGGGRLDGDVFRHELERAQGRVGSMYDATVTRDDPSPRRPLSNYPDPILEGLKAPLTSAMVAIYTDQLNWRPEGIYQLANDDAFRQWNWGRGMGRPESLSYLQSALSLDPRLHVLIAHGLFDMVTPYFTTVRELSQLPDAASAERVKLVVYPGGHMFYSGDASRAAFHADASALYRTP
jgi:carboxypeptidase C (cathepsin A)